MRAKLLAVRERRVRPGLDDKVLADWNGLMIAGLVNAGVMFEEPGWIDMAARAFGFIAETMTRGDRLGHSWRDGRLLLPGLASDYAAMIKAALALYEATGEPSYLERALAWQAAFDRYYRNPATDGYFLTADDAEGLVMRPDSTTDDAIPNPNAVAAHNLIRLAVLGRRRAMAHQRRPPDRRPAAARGGEPVRPHRPAQCHRPAAARRRDRGHRAGGAALCRSRAEAAVSRPHRAAGAEAAALPASHPAQAKIAATAGSPRPSSASARPARFRLPTPTGLRQR